PRVDHPVAVHVLVYHQAVRGIVRLLVTGLVHAQAGLAHDAVAVHVGEVRLGDGHGVGAARGGHFHADGPVTHAAAGQDSERVGVAAHGTATRHGGLAHLFAVRAPAIAQGDADGAGLLPGRGHHREVQRALTGLHRDHAGGG